MTDEEDPIKTNISSVELKSEVESDFENDDFSDENYKNKDEDEGSDSTESEHRKPMRRIETRSSRKVKCLNKGKTGLKSRDTFKELKGENKMKKPKPIRCVGTCKRQCDKIDENQRKKLCKEFWALSYVERLKYMLSCIERKPLGKLRVIKRKKKERELTNHYYLKTSDGERVRVCVKFFLKTLSTSNCLVKEALQNSDGKDIDLRGGVEERDNKLEIIKNQLNEKSIEPITMPINTEDSATRSTKNELPSTNTTALEATKQRETGRAETSEQNEISRADKSPNNLNAIESTVLAAGYAATLSLPLDKSTEVEAPIVKSKDSADTTVTAAQPEKRKKTVKKRKRGTPSEHAPRPVNCKASCRFECRKFTEEQRELLCAAFWRLSYTRRKDFALSHVEVHENTFTTAAEYRKSDRVRTYTNRFFLRGERGENVRVCSRFFYATLNVSYNFLANAQKNVDKQTGAYAGEDKRGKAVKWNKTSDTLISEVHEHINSYPTWVPHKSYKTRFLHSSLSVKKMYNEYKVECERQNKEMVSCGVFRNIFNKDFKLAFLQPTSKHAHKVSSQRKCVNVEEPKTIISSGNARTTAVPCTSTTTFTSPESTKKRSFNPNISIFTGEEGGFWSQLTPNATERMRLLQQRYAPQSSSSSSAPVLITPIYQQQQKPHQHQQQQQYTLHQLAQNQQQQQLVQHTHTAQPAVAQLPSTNMYQLPSQVVGYMHQPHIMNTPGSYESEERVHDFHML